MRIVLNYLKLKDDFSRLEILHWGHFAFIFLATTLESLSDYSFIEWFTKTTLLIIFYRLFFATKKQLFYSFWSFSAILSIYLTNRLFFSSHEFGDVGFLYLVASLLLGVEIYILSSPIYYPRVSWWEYDFRYRADLKIFVNKKDEDESDSRITDLRRNAGCVASFSDFVVGDELYLSSPVYFDGKLKAEIVSKRIYSLGRPYSFGVKFDLEDEPKLRAYKNLINVWKNEAVQRKQRKFRKQNV